MPEMPETEIIRRALDKYLPGRTIMNTEILLPRQIKWPDTEAFRAMLTGRKFTAAKRRGKYLLFTLDNESTLVVHLRMTGHLVYDESGASDKYARIRFVLDNGAVLTYGDSRTLGAIYALKKGEEGRIKGLIEMGAEPLSEEFTAEYLATVLKKRKTKIKQVLLDQKAIGGIGNIYADESLFKAKIHPARQANSLSDEETKILHAAINEAIADGIADGGTTFRDYQNAEGKKGSHQEKLCVYGKKGEPCPVCGTPIEKITVGGRGTHFCPKCQPL